MTGEMTSGGAEASWESLDELRRNIDRIDDALLALLVERAALGARIAAAKKQETNANSYGNVFLRPGREMEILRRLLTQVGGGFPKIAVVRMWRELFSALTSLQGSLTLSVYMPIRGAGFLELARDHYGVCSQVIAAPSSGAVVRAVTEGEAAIGILPLPRQEDPQPWWPTLMSDVASTPRIITRLPICGPGQGRGDGVEALAIARFPSEPTGIDQSLLAVESGSGLSRVGLRSILENAGFQVLDLIDSQAPMEGVRYHLFVIDGFVAPTDARLKALRYDQQIPRAVVIGTYAVPFSPAQLLAGGVSEAPVASL